MAGTDGRSGAAGFTTNGNLGIIAGGSMKIRVALKGTKAEDEKEAVENAKAEDEAEDKAQAEEKAKEEAGAKDEANE